MNVSAFGPATMQGRKIHAWVRSVRTSVSPRTFSTSALWAEYGNSAVPRAGTSSVSHVGLSS